MKARGTYMDSHLVRAKRRIGLSDHQRKSFELANTLVSIFTDTSITSQGLTYFRSRDDNQYPERRSVVGLSARRNFV